MNCEEFELSVRDLARSDLEDRNVVQSHSDDEHELALELGEARVHVDACEACALRLQDERALNRQLGALATGMAYFEPPARIESELLDAFRLRVPGSAGILPAFSRAPKRIETAYWLTAAAAVVLIVLGIVLVRAKFASQPGPNIQQPLAVEVPATDSTPVPVEGPNVKENASSPASDSGQNDKQMRRRPRQVKRQPAIADDYNNRATVAASAETRQPTEAQSAPEVTTQFIALSYVAPANLQDGGQIVRVELPRSAMASFGLPVNMERLGERVKADVLVSADGFARAIRFVQ